MMQFMMKIYQNQKNIHNRNKLYCTFTVLKFQCFLLKLNCWNDV